MKLQLTYEYRLYPNKHQEMQIQKTCNSVRYVYNKLLEDRTEHFRKTGEWKKLCLSEITAKSFLTGVDPGALTWAESRLEAAYRNFFRTIKTVPDKYRRESIEKSQKDPSYKLMDTDLVSYPRFKKKKKSKESYTTPSSGLTVSKGRTPLPYIGSVKIRYHRQIPEGAQILCVTVLKKTSGHYFLLVKFCMEEKPKPKDLQTALGVALAPGQLAVRSDNGLVFYRHQDAHLQKRIDTAYKTLKRRKPGSKRYEKQRKYLAALYEHRVNQRRDDLHKTARQITNAADVIYVQKADVHLQLNKLRPPKERTALLDEATYTFLAFIQYKTRMEGKRYWSVPKECMIYSICSCCGTLQRPEPAGNWVCSMCGSYKDYYRNAATNLQNIGQQYIRNIKK